MDAADDLLQETWIDVYRKINRLRLEAFKTWLYRIARDKAYRQLRRLPWQPAPLDGNLWDTVAAAEVVFTADEAEAGSPPSTNCPLSNATCWCCVSWTK